jgi:hypothetical protein
MSEGIEETQWRAASPHSGVTAIGSVYTKQKEQVHFEIIVLYMFSFFQEVNHYKAHLH